MKISDTRPTIKYTGESLITTERRASFFEEREKAIKIFKVKAIKELRALSPFFSLSNVRSHNAPDAEAILQLYDDAAGVRLTLWHLLTSRTKETAKDLNRIMDRLLAKARFAYALRHPEALFGQNLRIKCVGSTWCICASKAFRRASRFGRNCWLGSRSFASRSSRSCTWRESRWKGERREVNNSTLIELKSACLIAKNASTIRAALAIHWNWAFSDRWNMTPGLLVA